VPGIVGHPGSSKAHSSGIRTIRKGIDHTDRCISRHVILDPSRQERRLPPILADDASYENGRPVTEAASLNRSIRFQRRLPEAAL
jgi:hypothetical protein